LKNCWIKKLFVSVLRTDDPTYFSSCKFPVRLAGILLFHVKQCSWKTNCVRFGKIASLFAFVLFASGCVVRIDYESFLDYCFQEISLLPEWRTAFAHFS